MASFKATFLSRLDIDETKNTFDETKKKLLYHFETRPSRQELVDLNILVAFDEDESLGVVMDNLLKQRLQILLSNRGKSIQSLIRKGILKEIDSNQVEEEKEICENRRDMYRRMSNHSLTQFLSQRPTLKELVKSNMVHDVMTWTKIIYGGIVPKERNCHQMCINCDHNELYLVGGFNTGSVSIDLIKFNIYNQKWSRPLIGGNVPIERYCHSLVNIDNNLIIFGGFNVNEGKWVNDLYTLHTENTINCQYKSNNSQMLLWNKAETRGNIPSARAAHAACVIGKKMYIFGGNNDEESFNDLYCLDTLTFLWSKIKTNGSAPSPRSYHSLTSIGDEYLIVFGGNDGKQSFNDLYMFEINKNKWILASAYGTPPIARGGHTAACIQSKKQLLIFGGGYNNKLLNDLHIFDINTMSWIRPSDTGMIPEPRSGHSCCINTKDDIVYICGGGDCDNDKLFNDLYQLDTKYFTTDEKQINKLIYSAKQKKSNNNKKVSKNNSNFNQDSVISDDIMNVSQEIDGIIKTVQQSINHKINEFKQKEENYVLILQAIERERTKLMDDINRDMLTIKVSVKESLDKLQQKYNEDKLGKQIYQKQLQQKTKPKIIKDVASLEITKDIKHNNDSNSNKNNKLKDEIKESRVNQTSKISLNKNIESGPFESKKASNAVVSGVLAEHYQNIPKKKRRRRKRKRKKKNKIILINGNNVDVMPNANMFNDYIYNWINNGMNKDGIYNGMHPNDICHQRHHGPYQQYQQYQDYPHYQAYQQSQYVTDPTNQLHLHSISSLNPYTMGFPQ